MTEMNLIWWESLNHGGLLIGPKQLAAHFPQSAPPLNAWTVEQLRRHLNRFDAATKVDEKRAALPDLLNVVLEKVAGLDEENGTWCKDVGNEWSRALVTGESFKPRRVWTHPNGTAFPVFVSEDERLGIGRGVRSVSKVLEWLRKGSERIALLTNGRQWRLIHAGLDHDAWAQWDTEQWLAEGEPGPQISALQILLNPGTLLPQKSGELSPLLAAIDETRKGQAEVSAELGERVRKAVELLIQAHAAALDERGGELARKDVYLAAVRMVMRMVVILFAEARDLLPRDNALYFGSYGLQGLRESLRRAAGGRLERLRTRHGAWPRVLALFRLVYEGSPHRSLPVPRYGGELFRPGATDANDGIRDAVHLFETACFQHEVSDAVVYQMLEFITTTHVRVRQGTAAKVVPVPVNFADLSTEYIGMLYEGLLGYELRRVEDEDEAIVILKLGDEPALPLRRLEEMTDKTLEALVDKFKQKAAAVAVSEDEEEDDEEEPETESESPEESEDETPEAAEAEAESEEVEFDNRQMIRDRAVNWAKRAVVAGKLVSRPRSRREDVEHEYQLKITDKAKQITGAAYLPGQYFLIRSSGTRKGSGTFYTRPALAIPTTHRTLRPLAWIAPNDEDGKPNELAPVSEWTPRKPEEILALKVCDPACGSASFLVAALRFLTDSLYASLHHHGRIREQGDGALVTLAEGKESTGALAEETLPARPNDPSFEARLKARLKRYVVERCVYGVDYDRLAIELARMALWIETMDRELPFEFLDHKIKHGNALVGTWFDQFAMYPILAWDREAGDKSHTKFVNHFRATTNKQGKETRSGDPWNAALKDFYKNTAKPRYRDWLDGKMGLLDRVRPEDARKQHEEAVRLFEQLHAIPVQDSEARAEFYREKLAGNESYQKLKGAFDTWCAMWFWPADRLQDAPVATGALDAENLKGIVWRLQRDLHFFHWELEFPDVFREPGAGFDAMLGNPPWEISKPNSKEFFSRIDPLYRSYGKQEALDKQQNYFTRSAIDEAEWIRYNDYFKAMSNWASRIASPFGDGSAGGDRVPISRSQSDSEEYRRLIQSRRLSNGLSFSDPEHPFRHQGSADINLYKMFLEMSLALVRPGGRVGLIVPAGIYTDSGTGRLRRKLVDHSSLRFLVGFINWDRIFPNIYYRNKFAVIIVDKVVDDRLICAAFSRVEADDLNRLSDIVVRYSRNTLDRLAPRSGSVIEVRSESALEVLNKMYATATLVGDLHGEWSVHYACELHMTNDASKFIHRGGAEGQLYSTVDGLLWSGPEGAARPVMEGRMIDQYDASAKGWIRGTGRTAVWVENNWNHKQIEPQFLIRGAAASAAVSIRPERLKLAFMDVTSATNARTVIATVLPTCVPCGNSVPVLYTRHALELVAIFNSFSFDFVARARCGGVHVNWYLIDEMPVPLKAADVMPLLRCLSAALALAAPMFAAERTALAQHGENDQYTPPYTLDHRERRRLRCIIEALVAEAYSLSTEEFERIMKDCDLSPEDYSRVEVYRQLDPKGFWRVDKALPCGERLTMQAQSAFVDLRRRLTGQTRSSRILEEFVFGPDSWQLDSDRSSDQRSVNLLEETKC